MKKIVCFLLFMCLSIASVRAAEIDIAEISCQGFLNSNDPSRLIFWMDGYISAQSDNLLLSEEWLTHLAEQVAEYCVRYPRRSLMDAIEAL